MDLPNSMVTIKEDSLEQGVDYIISLAVEATSEVVAKYTFKVASISYEGSCTFEPPKGIKGQTLFDITCTQSGGFFYEFYDKSDEDLAEKTIFNGRMLRTNDLGSIEDVRLTRGNIAVYILHKDTGLHSLKTMKVELSPWDITKKEMEEMKTKLAEIISLQHLPSIMNYVSFIPDVLPEFADKSEMLDLLLGAFTQVTLGTVSDVKLSASTLTNVLKTLNKPSPLHVKTELMWKTLKIIRSQGEILGTAAMYRDIKRWMPSREIRQVALAILECLNVGLKCVDETTVGLSEDKMSFGTLLLLKGKALETEAIIDHIKDIVCYTHPPGLPPLELATADKSYRIWVMGSDEYNPVLNVLKKNEELPFIVSENFVKKYNKHQANQLYFQTALIKENIFSWSTSDVRSKLVSLSVATKERDVFNKIEFLLHPIEVKLGLEKSLTNTIARGKTLQLDPNLDPDSLDELLPVHRIDCPPKSFLQIRFLFPPTTESIRVYVGKRQRPDYDMMTSSKHVVVINSSTPPLTPFKNDHIDEALFLYMGVLPGENAPVNSTVDYEFEVTETLCRTWIGSQWSSIGCHVSEVAANETVCNCDHLSIFAAAFPVPPQNIDPIGDAKLFLDILDNPLIATFIVILFILFLITVLWGRYRDRVDQYKGKVIILGDNFPEDEFPYLVAVHTSARFNAGTTANVGIMIKGSEARSRAHILSSNQRKVLQRNSDDWFMIYTPRSLGDIFAINLWHDNTGSRPEWYCEKVVVYDMRRNIESVFVVEQWLALRRGDYPEANIQLANTQDLFNVKRMFLFNAVLGFRDSHTFLSVFVRHPRSGMTRVQRISTLMCFIMVAMLCNIMFFKPEDEEIPTDEYQYDVGTREIIISIQTLIIAAVLTVIVMFSFRRSYKVVQGSQHHTTLQYKKDDVGIPAQPESDRAVRDKSLYDNYVRYISRAFKNPPLQPVTMWMGEKKVHTRKIWFAIAWTACIFIICAAAYLIVLYGLKMGPIQSEKWLTALVISMFGDIFILNPSRIIFIAILLSLAFQVSTKVNIHGITLKDVMLARPKNEINYLNILLATRSHPMYAPLSSSAIQAMLQKKEIGRQWWNLIDFMNAVLFVVVVSFVINRLWISNYHGNNHLTHVFSQTHNEQFGATDLEKIRNISMVESYLEISLFEALFELYWYNRKELTDREKLILDPEGIYKYWVKDKLHKMIGKPLVRQVRVVSSGCNSRYFEHMMKCLLKWSQFNKDVSSYGEKWLSATYSDTQVENSPWKYKDKTTIFWWTNQRFYGISGTLYDVSGYETTIGPTMKEAEKTVNELRENKWQDWYTRACFFTATVYNMNSKVYSQVTVIFEYFVTGAFFSSMQVIPVSSNVVFGVWEVLFLFYGIYYVIRSGYLINRMGLMDYLKTLNNIIRLICVFLIYTVIFTWCVHHWSSITYAENYMKHSPDDYFDFDDFVEIFTLLQVILSLLLCFGIIRAIMLVRGGRRMLNFYYAFINSLNLIFWLTLIFLFLFFVLKTLLYFLHCQEYFRMKELVLTKNFAAFLRTDLFNYVNVQVFVIIRIVTMCLLIALLIIIFIYNIRIAKAHKIRETDDFHIVLFIIERVKKCFRQN